MSVPVLSQLFIADKQHKGPFHSTPIHHTRRHNKPMKNKPFPICCPNCLALRANPFPEVTDPICRLPLPTLFYQLEAIHLGDLMRLWVRTIESTENWIFKDWWYCTRVPMKWKPLPNHNPSRKLNLFQGLPFVNKKRQLFLGVPSMSSIHFRYRFLSIGSGILTWFPFDRLRPTSHFQRISPIS